MVGGNYVLKNGKGLYIHYNPHEQSYISGNSLSGAAVFTKERAESFREEFLPSEWFVENLKRAKISHSRMNEKDLYNLTHPGHTNQ